jgi:hypothetical protein
MLSTQVDNQKKLWHLSKFLLLVDYSLSLNKIKMSTYKVFSDANDRENRIINQLEHSTIRSANTSTVASVSADICVVISNLTNYDTNLTSKNLWKTCYFLIEKS